MKSVYGPASIVFAALILIAAAFYNGYPLFTADTATYLDAGFNLETPHDRPITYGLFVWAASLNGLSMWLVVAVQALLVAGLFYALLRQFLGPVRARIVLAGSAVLLSIATPLSWVVSSLMADVFTPVAALCLLLIFIGRWRRFPSILLHCLYFLAVAMHLSHVLLFGMLIILLFLLRRIIARAARQQYFGLRKMGLLLGLTVATIATMGSALSKSRHVFMMGAMAERGVLGAYLQERCPTENYTLCAWKDSLPRHGYDFVWNDHGPLAASGGWAGSKEEYNRIIRATLTQPKYIGLQISSSLWGTASQLGHFSIGNGNVPFGPETELGGYIAKFIPTDSGAFNNCRQNRSSLGLTDRWQGLINAGILLAVLSLILYAGRIRRTPVLRTMLAILLIAVILNAWDCATFANVLDRLGARMAPLVTIASLIVLCYPAGRGPKHTPAII